MLVVNDRGNSFVRFVEFMLCDCYSLVFTVVGNFCCFCFQVHAVYDNHSWMFENNVVKIKPGSCHNGLFYVMYLLTNFSVSFAKPSPHGLQVDCDRWHAVIEFYMWKSLYYSQITGKNN